MAKREERIFMILLTRLNTENDRLVMKSIQLYFRKLYYCERFELRSDFVSWLRIIVTLTLKMTTAKVVETSVTVNNKSPIQD